LANGWKGACVEIRGDWEFYAQCLGLPRWDSPENCCWLCKASNVHPSLFWTNFSRTATWRTQYRTHSSWLAELAARGCATPNLFKVRTLRLESVMVDTLHCVDQGVAVHTIANIFVEVMNTGAFGSNQKEQAAKLHTAMNEWYKLQPNSTKSSRLQGELTYERIKTSGDWPKLKCKAAATRHLAEFAAMLAQKYNTGTVHDQRRQLVADMLVKFYKTIDQGGMVLRDLELGTLSHTASSFLGAYAALSKEALSSGKRLWKLVPKFHMFAHLCEYRRNPRCFWVYADEDLQRHVKDIASSCSMMNLEPMVLFKWIVLVFDVLAHEGSVA
jgi:hypothetical protein